VAAFHRPGALLERQLRRGDLGRRWIAPVSPNFRQPYNTLIAALGQVGRQEEGQAVMADGLVRFGDAFRKLMALPLDELRELRAEDRERMIDGFRKAGVA